ncbi:MAG: DHH family phosphoesterase [Candidatus Anstonellaceae archaeon]
MPANPYSSSIRKALFNLRNYNRIFVTSHLLADLDAVCAGLVLCRVFGKKCKLALPDSPSAAARHFLEYIQASTIPFSQVTLQKNDALVVVDCSSPALAPHLVGKQADLSIDHHSNTAHLPSKKRINDPSASSTCEMLYFLLKPRDKLSSIALLVGILSDSAGFQSATSRTFEAVSHLLRQSGLSYSSLRQLAFSPNSLSERIEALRSCQTVWAERVGQRIIATAFAKSHEAHFADLLIAMGADLAFVAYLGNEGRISARMHPSMKGMVYLDQIMEQAGKVLGGSGGGHELAAGASGSRQGVKEALDVCVKLAQDQILLAESGKIKKIEW